MQTTNWGSSRIIALWLGVLLAATLALLLPACASTPAQRLSVLQDSYETALDKALFYQTAGLLAPAEEARLSAAFDQFDVSTVAARAALAAGEQPGGALGQASAALSAAEGILIQQARRSRGAR